MSDYGVTVNGSYSVLFTISILFTIIALISCGKIPIPSFLKAILIPQSSDDGLSIDFFLSARNSADYKTIALSFFSSGMGAWVLYGTTTMGATPSLSWFGVIGYSMASALPGFIICLIGPKVREMSGASAFGTSDFAKERYGRIMQLIVAFISVFGMFIGMVSELTAISNVYGILVGKDVTGDDNKNYTESIVWIISLFTLFYTTLAGLPASIVTDKLQGIMIVFLMIVLLIATTSQKENRVSPSEFNVASNWTEEGFMAMITLFLAILSASAFDQGSWQRVWASKDVTSMRKGFFIGSVMVFLLLFFFGIMGMISYASDPSSYDNGNKLAYLSFFDLLIPCPPFVSYLALIFVTSLAASSIDTVQNAIISVFSHDILTIPRCQSTIPYLPFNTTISSSTTRFLLVALNVPAVIMSAQRYDVISLFLITDLVCSTAVLPVFLGLISEKKLGGFFTPITELGAILGIMSGFSAVLINAAVLNFTEATDSNGKVLGTGPFSYFWLTNSDICSICGSKTMVTFIITPLSGGLGAILFSHLDILIRGEHDAHKPLFNTYFKMLENRIGIDQDDNHEESKDEIWSDDNGNTTESDDYSKDIRNTKLV